MISLTDQQKKQWEISKFHLEKSRESLWGMETPRPMFFGYLDEEIRKVLEFEKKLDEEIKDTPVLYKGR